MLFLFVSLYQKSVLSLGILACLDTQMLKPEIR